MKRDSKARRSQPAWYLNRELSWLEFNQRVLDEASNSEVPLLERVKFWCITHSNLDEFFEVRVAGLKQQVESGVRDRSPDGLTPAEALRQVLARVRRMTAEADALWQGELVPALALHGIRFLEPTALAESDREWLREYYRREVHLVLTPLSIDPSHPFPLLLNKSLNLMVQLTLERDGVPEARLAVVQVPRVLPRLVALPRDDQRRDYVLLARVIAWQLGELFPGTTVEGCWPIRVTRNSELYIDEEDVSNVLKAVERELHNRRRGEAVRLEVDADCPDSIRKFLLSKLDLAEADLFVVGGLVNPTRMMSIVVGDHSPELRDAPFVAPVAASLREAKDLFAAIRERDHLMHHPYESFETVVEFLRQAAVDPDVLAVKQTLYRTGGDERVVGALMEAVRNGKQVTAVVELKARFDEANNIQWAKRLENAGVHVVYGLVGYKIHGKLALVVRREADCIRRYVHLATGNYNPSTARLYTDLGLLTAREEIAADVTSLFNLLTGVCQFQPMSKLVMAPFQLHERMVSLIRREAENAKLGLPARIIVKLNSLVDEEIIRAMYDASNAGVRIDLIIRGICCLRPGVRGLSENIRVRSVVDRFLEHSRVYYFENGLQPEVYVSSADWMPRNFFGRIEVAFPIEDGVLRERVIREVLEFSLQDSVKARELGADGMYRRVQAASGQKPFRSQQEFIRRASSGVEASGFGEAENRARARKRPGKLRVRVRAED